MFDPLTAPLWDDTNSVRVPAAQLPLYAQEVRYVIHRLCAPAAPIPAVVLPDPDYCVSASSGVGGASKKGLVHGTGHLTGTGAVYFRITSRVMLANRNTVSFVQTVMF